ncbi:MAG: hypothetical protein H7Y86_07430 [Rhizobacter sp.]|nr:hypothetical protein [Ferruginibacter sp.]
MYSNQISAFEYVSILVSIILGLGITQILSSFSDLLYHYKEIKFYWPHTLWILFILFLNIQDWFITYQLKDKLEWSLPELFFILLYPITLFIAAKMLLPANESDKGTDMKLYYRSHYPVIFFIIAVAVFISILFNVFLLEKSWLQQLLLLVFFSLIMYISIRKVENELLHKWMAVLLGATSVLSVILEKNVWVIK